MLARTLGPQEGWIGGVPYRLEKETSAREDVRPQKGVDYGSHLDWGGERR